MNVLNETRCDLGLVTNHRPETSRGHGKVSREAFVTTRPIAALGFKRPSAAMSSANARARRDH